MGRIPFALLFLLAIALLPAPALAQAFPERGRNAVVDAAGVIPDGQEAALAARLTAWQRETGHQLVVATVPDLQGRRISDYAVDLFRHWRLGRAGANDGILLLLAPNQRRVRIEVGYGLEGSLTDAQASRIIRETIAPALDENPGAALTAGAERIMEVAGALPAAAAPASAAPARFVDRPHPDDEGPSGTSVLLIAMSLFLAIFAFIIWLVRRGSREPRPAEPVAPSGKRGRGRRSGRTATAAAASTGYDGAFAHSSHSGDYSSFSDSSSSSSSSDSGGFDSGGGSSGGGGADSSY